MEEFRLVPWVIACYYLLIYIYIQCIHEMSTAFSCPSGRANFDGQELLSFSLRPCGCQEGTTKHLWYIYIYIYICPGYSWYLHGEFFLAWQPSRQSLVTGLTESDGAQHFRDCWGTWRSSGSMPLREIWGRWNWGPCHHALRCPISMYTSCSNERPEYECCYCTEYEYHCSTTMYLLDISWYIYMAYIGQHRGMFRKQVVGYSCKGTHIIPLMFSR